MTRTTRHISAFLESFVVGRDRSRDNPPGIARTSTAISLGQAIPYRPHALLRAVAESG